MSNKNYTTKEIELPLSTDKEYVLVGVGEYMNTGGYETSKLTAAFKLDSVDVDGDGKLDDLWVIQCGNDEHELFREVVREIPHTEQEDEAFNAIQSASGAIEESVVWDGEGLPPVGVECECDYPRRSWHKVKYMGCDFQGLHVIAYENGRIEQLGSLVKFRKPETEAQRIEREKLESAYDLYLHVKKVMNCPTQSFEQFSGDTIASCKYEYLILVDKTGYRKGGSNA